MVRYSPRCMVLLLFQCVFWVSQSAVAQRITSTLNGEVTDESGAVVVGATVKARNQDTNIERNSVTNEHGSYSIHFLNPGTYDVIVEQAGFKRQIAKGIVLEVNQTAQLNFKLAVGELAQEVSVEAAAPLLQTSESSVGSVIAGKQIHDLPLNGRQFLQLALLVPGAVQSPAGGRQSTERGTQASAININGNRESSNLFLIDGSINTDPNFNTFAISPIIDSIQEFKVQTNSYSAEFGQQAGGQINLITRSGTNQYHGTAYEFLRNSALDAKNLFDRPAPFKTPPFRQNQFGATFGGPIHKDRTFVFGAYEGFRSVKAQTATAVVPDQAIRRGDFSNRRNAAGQLTPIYDPATTRLNPNFKPGLLASPTNPQYLRDQFPNNIIPADRIDPIARGILGYVDLPNSGLLPLGQARFLNNESVRQVWDQFSVRIDHSLSPKDQLFGRFSFSDESVIQPGGLTSQATRREPRPQIFTLGYTRFFNPQIANDARFGFTRFRLNVVNKNAFTENIPSKLGIRGQEGLPPSAWEVPNVAFTEGFSVIGGANFGVPTVTRNNTFQFQDTLTVNRGDHSMRMGFQWNHYQLNNATLNFILPSFGLRATPLTAHVANPVGIERGSEFADFLLGISHVNQVTSGSGQVYLRREIVAPWFEDTWRITPDLTLTLGLRWDFISPLVEKFDRFGSVFVPALNGPRKPIPMQAGVNVSGYGQVPRGVINTDKNNWAPRLGIAYRLGGSDKTVLRAGFGMFYDAQIGNTTVDLVRNAPFQTRIIAELPNSIFPFLSLRDLTPPGVTIASSFFAMGQEEEGRLAWPTAYVEQWNLSLQREFVPNWAVTAAYVGSTGRHFSYSGIANIPYPGPGDLNPRRPYFPDLNVIFQIALPRVNTYYHSFQLKSEHRNTHGLTMLTAYTFSKSIDTQQEIRGAGGGGSTQAINNWDLDGQNRGLSSFNQAHRLVNSFLYELPFGKGKRFLSNGGVVGQIFGDWQINSITTLNTGFPFTVYSGVDTAGSGVGSLVHANFLPGASLYPSTQSTTQWFNPAAFGSAPDCRQQTVFASLSNPLVCFGNVGRNSLTGPGLVNFDFALLKRFRLSEQQNIEFRTEIFNLFNTPPLAMPVNTLTNPAAGRILAAGRAREIQFALRYSF